MYLMIVTNFEMFHDVYGPKSYFEFGEDEYDKYICEVRDLRLGINDFNGQIPMASRVELYRQDPVERNWVYQDVWVCPTTPEKHLEEKYA